MKKTKKKNKNKISIWKIAIITTVIIVLGLIIFVVLTKEDEKTGLTLLEKQWVEKNKSELIDFNVPNNINILGENGEGILFSILDTIEEDTGLQFNRKSYNYPSTEVNDSLGFAILKNTDKLLDSDIIVAEDSYILLGRDKNYIKDVDSLSNITIGVLKADEEIIKDYFKRNNNITINTYDSETSLYNDLLTLKINYVVVPRYANLSGYALKEGVYTNYNLNNITNKIVLRLGDNEKLNKILSKYIRYFAEEKYDDYLQEYLMKFYSDNMELTSVDQASLTSKTYTYGFIDSNVYNKESSGKLYGIAGEYINTLSKMAGVEFDKKAYDNKQDLIKDFESGKIDIAFINFDYENDKALNTSSPFITKMVALSNTYKNISDSYGLANNKLYLFKDNLLYNYIKDKYDGNITTIDNINYNISDGILILDECEYLYYKESSLNELKQLFTDYYDGDLRFIVNDKDEVLYNMMNFVLNNTDYNEYRKLGINNLLNTMTKEESFKNIYMIAILIIFVPIFIAILSSIIKRVKPKFNKLTKEDMLRYTDLLTSLKNRNYLNAHITEWDETKIYPRTIIMVDLNNLKYINDNYGQKEGNILIKQAAAILINTQLEKSEIVRTDGNEFLIYLLGYSKTQINTYISKLSKDF